MLLLTARSNAGQKSGPMRRLKMLTRELLYTALTRQKKKIVVLHQGSSTDLQRLSSERYSATATRLTNLFGTPKPVAVGGIFLEGAIDTSYEPRRGRALPTPARLM